MRVVGLYRATLFLCFPVAVLVMGAGRAVPIAAQGRSPSVYLGLGTGTNVGGTVGMGVEAPVRQHFAASAAVGVWPEALRGEAFAARAFDFDLGVKMYPVGRWLFTGINYGIIHADIITTQADPSPRLRKRHGFTFSLGLRTTSVHRLYASSFVGVTSDGEANHLTTFDRRTFMPHFGLMIGWDLSTTR